MSDLPEPNGAFEWLQAASGPALVCRPLSALAQHLYTSRAWALGQPARGEIAGWAEVAAAVAVDPEMLVRLHQVHGTTVVIASADDRNRHAVDDADIIVSHEPAHAVAVQVADCVPLLVADRQNGAIAAAHAGWRGLAARVPSTTVAAMRRQFGSRPADLVAAVGPSIGGCCYEVGEDVLQRFQRAGFGLDRLEHWFQSRPTPSGRNPSMPGLAAPREGHWFFDSWAAARDQLIGAGIPKSQVFVAELCTASHPSALCSFRRDGSPAGRLAAVIRRGAHHP